MATDCGNELPFRWGASGSVGCFRFTRAEPDNLRFEAEIHQLPDYDVDLKDGSFVRELWKRDVVELFVLCATEGAEPEYLEFNLAPSGAYWVARFCGIRSEIEEHPELVVSSSTAVSASGWRVTADLALDCQAPLLGNVTTISLCRKTQRRRFASWLELTSEQPDFHRPSEFAPLPIRSG